VFWTALFVSMRGLSFKIGNLRRRAEFRQQLCTAFQTCEPGNLALWIVQIAKDHGASGARLHTGWINFAVLQLAAFRSGVNFCSGDPLVTKRALLHHTDFAHGNIRIELEMQRLVPNGIEPIKEPYCVRTGVRTIASTNAAVVYLRVQTFLIV